MTLRLSHWLATTRVGLREAARELENMSLDPLRLSENVSERSLQCIVLWGGKRPGATQDAQLRTRGGLVVGTAQGKRRGAISIGQEREIGGTARVHRAQDAWLFGEARSRYGHSEKRYACAY